MSETTVPWRIVLDTNIVMDMLHFSDQRTRWLRTAMDAGRVQCFTDSQCLAELARVTAYPEFALDVPARKNILESYRGLASIVDPQAPEDYGLPRCRDPDDQKFLILAVRCAAHCLLTRDKLLLKLARHRHKPPPYAILTADAAAAHLGILLVEPVS